MANFKVLKDFRGIREDKDFKAGEVIELTVKRAEEIESNIKENFNVEGYLERVEDTKENKDKAEK